MSELPGETVGPYKLISKIGAGGMGVVWAAEDVRLQRRVAIKFLPTARSGDPRALDRFRREAQTASGLNHPNICTIHDIGTTADGQPFMVMELLEGQTLRSRLNSGSIPTGQASEWSTQVLRGLQAAHAKGIVHRDLKPENLFITSDGPVKILDFGLAKLIAPSMSPSSTETQEAHTIPGAILGSIGYMSPEQVRGEAADGRADIFAFGAILYEMVSGRLAFQAPSVPGTMRAILDTDPPDPDTLTHSGQTGLLRIIRRCLDKNPDRRFQSAADLAFAIDTLTIPSVASVATAGARRSRAQTIAWLGVVAAVILLAFLASNPFAHGSSGPSPFAVLSVLPPEGAAGTAVLSPDGNWVAFAGAGGQLWIKPIDGTRGRALPGTVQASNPFWSPDSKSVGFFADLKLQIIPIAGGPPRVLCPVEQNRGGTWNAAGDIIFAPNLGGPLYRTSENGGACTALTTTDDVRGERTHRWPYFLPDGRHYLYFVRTTRAEFDGVYVGSLDGTPPRRVLASSTNAVYSPAGFILFARDGTLMAQAFDARTQTPSGTVHPIAEGEGYALELNRATVSVSDTGMLAYGGVETRRPIWFNRHGDGTTSVGPPDFYAQIALSADGRQVLLDRPDVSGANEIAAIDVTSLIPTRLTTAPDSDVRPIWRGNDRLVWTSNRRDGKVYDLYEKAAMGSAPDRALLVSDESKYATDLSRNGRWAVYESWSTSSNGDIWILDVDQPARRCRVLGTAATERQARLSPNGRWLAYLTNRDGTPEIYVTDVQRAFEQAAALTAPGECAASTGVRVSPAGGAQPAWRGNSEELFYVAPDRQLMAVPIGQQPSLHPGAPVPLFRAAIWDRDGSSQTYVPAGDGQTFLILTPTRTTDATTVVLNWTRMLER